MKNLLRSFVIALIGSASLMTCVSCNVYHSLSSPSNDEDYREEARKCEQDGDFACAASNYQLLSDVGERNQKLCVVYMGQAGLSLDALLNIVSEKSSGAKLLGNLANAVETWTTVRGTAAANAVLSCSALPQTGTNGNLGVLLKAVSLMLDCSVRISRATVQVANSQADQACTTPGSGATTVAATDVSTQADGSIPGGSTGMCPADVLACSTNVIAISVAALTSAGLGNIAANVSSIPPALLNSASADAAKRSALRSTTTVDHH